MFSNNTKKLYPESDIIMEDNNQINPRYMLEYLGVDFEYIDKHIHYTYPSKYLFSDYLYDNIELLYQFLSENKIYDIKNIMSKMKKINEGINELRKIQNSNRIIKSDGEFVKDNKKFIDDKIENGLRNYIEKNIKKIIITENTNKAIVEYLYNSRINETISVLDSRVCFELINSIDNFDDYSYSHDKILEEYVWTPSDGLLRLIKYMDVNKE